MNAQKFSKSKFAMTKKMNTRPKHLAILPPKPNVRSKKDHDSLRGIICFTVILCATITLEVLFVYLQYFGD